MITEFIQQHRGHNQITKRADMRLSLHGISFSEYNILHYLAETVSDKGVMRMQLAEALSYSPSGITRLLKPMEKIGLVAKIHSVRDARQSLVELTNSGREIYNDASITLSNMLGE